MLGNHTHNPRSFAILPLKAYWLFNYVSSNADLVRICSHKVFDHLNS